LVNGRELELLVKDGRHEVDGHRDPDLGLHRVGTGAKAVFDTQVAFDPFEEEFDLPSRLVELGYRKRRDLQIVGEEAEMVESFAPCFETSGYVAQSFPPGQLRKSHEDQLLSAPTMPNLALGIIALNQPVERLPMSELEDLGEDTAASVHG
jgi:hypothetical protein